MGGMKQMPGKKQPPQGGGGWGSTMLPAQGGALDAQSAGWPGPTRDNTAPGGLQAPGGPTGPSIQLPGVLGGQPAPAPGGAVSSTGGAYQPVSGPYPMPPPADTGGTYQPVSGPYPNPNPPVDYQPMPKPNLPMPSPPPPTPGARDPFPSRPEIPPPGGEAPGATQPPVQPPTSIYDVYEKGRARMQEDANRGIEQAMATAGFGGNRYGSSAMNAAGEQQRRYELPFQQNWTDMLYNQGQSDLNRQLQAAQFGMQQNLAREQLSLQSMLGQGNLGLNAAQGYEQMMMDRIKQMFGMGSAETARGDQWNQLGFDEWMQSRFGMLPMILNALGKQPVAGGGSPGSISTGGGGSGDFWSSIIPILMQM